MQEIVFKDLGRMDYKSAWDYQESLLQENLQVKAIRRNREAELTASTSSRNQQEQPVVQADTDLFDSVLNAVREENFIDAFPLSTTNYLLFVEHSPVYTLGKSGDMKNLLVTEEEMQNKQIEFFKTNRGGDITFHGPGQIVGYPILDLENFYTDIGRYLRNLEEVIILTLLEYGLKGERSPGETGVWLEPTVKGKERKICAMGVRCSRWITMHGFAFNINTDLKYFNHIIPCGIENKKVTSLQQELGRTVNIEEVKHSLRRNFEKVFEASIRFEV